jgi:hypothetical protein
MREGRGHCSAPSCRMERLTNVAAGRAFYLRVRRLAFLAVRLREVFFGTFAPAALASERPIAMACLRLLTFRPERPLFNVPALRFFIARSTVLDAFFEYFRAMIFSRFWETIVMAGDGSRAEGRAA